MRASSIAVLLTPVLGVRGPTYVLNGRAIEEAGTRPSPAASASAPSVVDLDPTNIVSGAQSAEYYADVQDEGLQAAAPDKSTLFRPFTSFTSALKGAKPAMLNSSDGHADDNEGLRRLQSCVEWDATNAPPGDAFTVSSRVSAIIRLWLGAPDEYEATLSLLNCPTGDSDVLTQVWSSPWSRSEVCKTHQTFSDSSVSECSGTLVGPYHFMTARHCTFDPCRGDAKIVRIACGFGYVDGDGIDDYAHFGTAFGTDFVYYPSYDESRTCGDVGLGDIERDMVLYRLDRAVGVNLGYFGVTYDSFSSMNIMGFPADTRLNSYVAHADSRLFHRFQEVTQGTVGDYYYSDLWLFPGETGGPWYAYYTSTDTREIGAVSVGGTTGTGCLVYAAKVKDVWVDAVNAMKGQPSNSTLQPWTPPPDYCHIVQYQADLYNSFNGAPMRGVGSSTQDYAYSTYGTSDSFVAVIILRNIGNIAGTFSLQYFARSASSGADTFLRSISVTLDPFGLSRITVVLGASWTDSEVRDIYVDWSATSCFTNDGDWAYLGSVFKTGEPTPEPTPEPTLMPVSPECGPDVGAVCGWGQPCCRQDGVCGITGDFCNSDCLSAYSFRSTCAHDEDGLATATPSPTTVNNCPSGWVEFNNMCWSITAEAYRRWTKCEEACSPGWHACIADEAENRFLADLTYAQRVPEVWIGASDEATEGVWEWTESCPVSSDFTAWSPNEPNNGATSGKVQNCAAMWNKVDGGWDDKACTDFKAACACQMPIPAPPSHVEYYINPFDSVAAVLTHGDAATTTVSAARDFNGLPTSVYSTRYYAGTEAATGADAKLPTKTVPQALVEWNSSVLTTFQDVGDSYKLIKRAVFEGAVMDFVYMIDDQVANSSQLERSAPTGWRVEFSSLLGTFTFNTPIFSDNLVVRSPQKLNSTPVHDISPWLNATRFGFSAEFTDAQGSPLDAEDVAFIVQFRDGKILPVTNKIQLLAPQFSGSFYSVSLPFYQAPMNNSAWLALVLLGTDIQLLYACQVLSLFQQAATAARLCDTISSAVLRLSNSPEAMHAAQACPTIVASWSETCNFDANVLASTTLGTVSMPWSNVQEIPDMVPFNEIELPSNIPSLVDVVDSSLEFSRDAVVSTAGRVLASVVSDFVSATETLVLEPIVKGARYVASQVACAASSAYSTATVVYDSIKAECNGLQNAGDSTPDTTRIDLRQSFGSFKFSYETYSVKDQITITHGGNAIFDSGCVGTLGWTTVTISLSPADTNDIVVSVNPNCGTQGDTLWEYIVPCSALPSSSLESTIRPVVPVTQVSCPNEEAKLSCGDYCECSQRCHRGVASDSTVCQPESKGIFSFERDTNGCGGQGSAFGTSDDAWIDAINPIQSVIGDTSSVAYRDDLIDICNVHDACYASCGASRSDCDQTFCDHLQSACDRHDSEFCYLAASSFCCFVKDNGASFFNEAQHKFCTCKDCT